LYGKTEKKKCREERQGALNKRRNESPNGVLGGTKNAQWSLQGGGVVGNGGCRGVKKREGSRKLGGGKGHTNVPPKQRPLPRIKTKQAR